MSICAREPAASRERENQLGLTEAKLLLTSKSESSEGEDGELHG